MEEEEEEALGLDWIEQTWNMSQARLVQNLLALCKFFGEEHIYFPAAETNTVHHIVFIFRKMFDCECNLYSKCINKETIYIFFAAN